MEMQSQILQSFIALNEFYLNKDCGIQKGYKTVFSSLLVMDRLQGNKRFHDPMKRDGEYLPM